MPVFAMLSEGAHVCVYVHGDARSHVSQDAWMCVCAWLLNDASVRKGAVLQGVHMILHAAWYVLCWGLYSYMNASVCLFMHVRGKTTV